MGFWSDLTEAVSPKQGRREDMQQDYSTVVIEGCEYIQVSSLTGLSMGIYSLTHKGNCSNPTHGRRAHDHEVKL